MLLFSLDISTFGEKILISDVISHLILHVMFLFLGHCLSMLVQFWILNCKYSLSIVSWFSERHWSKWRYIYMFGYNYIYITVLAFLLKAMLTAFFGWKVCKCIIIFWQCWFLTVVFVLPEGRGRLKDLVSVNQLQVSRYGFYLIVFKHL